MGVSRVTMVVLVIMSQRNGFQGNEWFKLQIIR